MTHDELCKGYIAGARAVGFLEGLLRGGDVPERCEARAKEIVAQFDAIQRPALAAEKAAA